jgi:hypothetical protein
MAVTQSGKETLREIYRVRFPQPAGEDVIWKDKDSQNLEHFLLTGRTGNSL